MVAAVLFDIDGTLIDSNALHVEAWARVFSEGGHAIARERIASQIGKGGDNLVPALLPHLDDAAQKRYADLHGTLFKADYLRQAQPFPQARALLERVHASGAKVVLASSASAEELDHYIELMGVGPLVAARTSSDDVETTKPAPDIFAVALEKAGVAAADAVAVGDTPYDAQSAKGAGVATVAVLSGGFAEEELRAAGAVAVYPDVAALLAEFAESPLA